MKGFYRIIAGAVLALSGVGVMAQTEITADMIWREGTTWTEVSVNGIKNNAKRIERKLVPVMVNGYKYLTPETIYYYDGEVIKSDLKSSDDFEANNVSEYYTENQSDIDIIPYVRLEDDKVYVYVKYFDCELIMYDFNTWTDGGVAVFEFIWDNFEQMSIEQRTQRISVLQIEPLDPDKRFVGRSYGSNVKGLGCLGSELLCYYRSFMPSDGSGSWKVIEVKTPELGVVYRHPNYSEYDKYAGVEAIEAGVGEPEIAVSGDAVTVTSEAEVDVLVYTVTGMEVRRGVCLGSLRVPLNPGLYIVRAGTVTRKVQI